MVSLLFVHFAIFAVSPVLPVFYFCTYAQNTRRRNNSFVRLSGILHDRNIRVGLGGSHGHIPVGSGTNRASTELVLEL